MKSALAAFVLMVLVPLLALAQAAVPPLTGHVVDLTATLTTEQAQELERILRSFEEQKGSQIAVLMVPTTQPETIEQYSIRVAAQWKLGRRNVDDGAILLVARNDRTLRIEVGYGLEGVLNDAVCNRIITEVIVPRFQRGDYFGGISEGVGRMTRLVEGETLPAAGEDSSGPAGLGQLAPLLFIVVLITAVVARAILGRVPGAFVAAGVAGLIAWWLAGVVIALLAAFIAFVFAFAGLWGMWRGWPGGPGAWGGGFRGGGGGFGGGGASGRW